MNAYPSKVTATEVINKTTRHGFGRDVWKQLEPLQAKEPMHIYGNKTAWWNAEISLAFLDHHFSYRTPNSPPIMLMLDNFGGHLTEDVKARAKIYNIVLKKVPAGLTWLAQPADVAWIKPFKDSLRQSWISTLRLQLSEHRRTSPGARFSLVPPSRETVIEWVGSAWRGIAPSTLVAGSRRCKFLPTEPSVDEGPQCDPEDDHASDMVAALGQDGQTVGAALTEC